MIYGVISPAIMFDIGQGSGVVYYREDSAYIHLQLLLEYDDYEEEDEDDQEELHDH